MASPILFVLAPRIALSSAEMSLHLAMFAVEGLAGLAQVRLDAQYHVDPARNAISIDGGTEVGQMLARIFTSLLLREHGEGAFQIERCALQPAEVHA